MEAVARERVQHMDGNPDCGEEKVLHGATWRRVALREWWHLNGAGAYAGRGGSGVHGALNTRCGRCGALPRPRGAGAAG